MSNHANKASGAPSSGRSAIRGRNSTYLSSVQKQSRSQSSTKPANMKGSDNSETVGGGSDPSNTPATPTTGSYGSGHYTPNQG